MNVQAQGELLGVGTAARPMGAIAVKIVYEDARDHQREVVDVKQLPEAEQ